MLKETQHLMSSILTYEHIVFIIGIIGLIGFIISLIWFTIKECLNVKRMTLQNSKNLLTTQKVELDINNVNNEAKELFTTNQDDTEFVISTIGSCYIMFLAYNNTSIKKDLPIALISDGPNSFSNIWTTGIPIKAPFSGKLIINEQLFPNMWPQKIYLTPNYENKMDICSFVKQDNSTDRQSYYLDFFSFDKQEWGGDIPKVTSFEHLVQENQFVQEGVFVMRLKLNYTCEHMIKSHHEGFYHIETWNSSTCPKQGDCLFSIEQTRHFSIESDPFTEKVHVKSCNVYCFGAIYLSLNNQAGEHYLIITHKKGLPIANKHTFTLLLEDNSILVLSINRSPIKTWGIFMNDTREVPTSISTRELEKLSSLRLVEWQLSDKNGFIYECGQNRVEADNSTQRDIFREHVIDYIKTCKQQNVYINHFTNCHSTSIGVPCYVYLMEDTTNGYIKIGMSVDPHYREKTLQSEKPSIILRKTRKYPNRETAAAIEKMFHTLFSSKRIRGEWFNLNNEDIENILQTL